MKVHRASKIGVIKSDILNHVHGQGSVPSLYTMLIQLNCVPNTVQLTSIEESLKNSSSISATETPETSTFCDVAITYAWLARLRGTPLILYGPVEIKQSYKTDLSFKLNRFACLTHVPQLS